MSKWVPVVPRWGPLAPLMGSNEPGRPLFLVSRSALRVPLGALMGPDGAPIGPDGALDGQFDLIGLVSGRVLQASEPALTFANWHAASWHMSWGASGAPWISLGQLWSHALRATAPPEVSRAVFLEPFGA